jgi:hypothetical protein
MTIVILVKHAGVVATTTSLTLPSDLSAADWAKIGADLSRANSMLAWLVGDWWNAGHRYGERRAMVEDEDWSGPSFQSCQDCGWVCRQFATSRRREVLTFSHHREVAPLARLEADSLLDWCLPRGLRRRRSVRELRDEAQRRRNKPLRHRDATEVDPEWLRKQLRSPPAPTAADVARLCAAAKREIFDDGLPKRPLELSPSQQAECHAAIKKFLRSLDSQRTEIAAISLGERVHLVNMFMKIMQVEGDEVTLPGGTKFVQ